MTIILVLIFIACTAAMFYVCGGMRPKFKIKDPDAPPFSFMNSGILVLLIPIGLFCFFKVVVGETHQSRTSGSRPAPLDIPKIFKYTYKGTSKQWVLHVSSSKEWPSESVQMNLETHNHLGPELNNTGTYSLNITADKKPYKTAEEVFIQPILETLTPDYCDDGRIPSGILFGYRIDGMPSAVPELRLDVFRTHYTCGPKKYYLHAPSIRFDSPGVHTVQWKGMLPFCKEKVPDRESCKVTQDVYVESNMLEINVTE